MCSVLPVPDEGIHPAIVYQGSGLLLDQKVTMSRPDY